MHHSLRLRPLGAGLATALIAGLALSGTVQAQDQTDDLTIFAAASLTDAMGEVADSFEDATGYETTVSFAGSSALARQIQQGAPADIFVSANQDWMDTLQQEDLIVADSRVDLLNNALVLIAHGENAEAVEIGPSLDLSQMLGDGRLAMALVDAVPAGIYGKSALESLDLWTSVEDHVAQADNVRAALALVATGEAPYGIVYRTDAEAEDDVTIVGTFPEDSHPPIVYPAAILEESDSSIAGDFMDYLQGDEAGAIFQRYGFGLPGN